MRLEVSKVSLAVAGRSTAWVLAQVGNITYRFNKPMPRVDAWLLFDRVHKAPVIDTRYWTRR